MLFIRKTNPTTYVDILMDYASEILHKLKFTGVTWPIDSHH